MLLNSSLHNKSFSTSIFRGLLSLCFVFLFYLPPTANDVTAASKVWVMDTQPAVLLNADTVKERDIGGYLKVYVDRSGTMSLQDVVVQGQQAFIDMDDVTVGQSDSRTQYWLYGRVRKSNLDGGGDQSKWRLVLPGYHILESAFYLKPSSEQEYRQVPPLYDRSLAYPVEMSSQNTSEFYLKLRVDGSLNMSIRIWEEQSYLLSKRKSVIGWGLFFGSVLALFAYNVFVFVSLREARYLYLSGFLLSAFALILVKEKFLADYFNLSAEYLGQSSEMAMQCLALLFASSMSRHYLMTHSRFPNLDKALIVAMLLSLLLGVSAFSGVLSVYSFKLMFSAISAIFFVPAVVVSLQLSDRASRFYLLGWSVFVIGYVVFQLAEFNIIPSNTFTIHLKEFALSLLGVLLSLGVAAQIQTERSAKGKGLTLQQETMLELKYAEEQIQKKVLRDTLQEYPGQDLLESIANENIASLATTQASVTLVLVEMIQLDTVEKQLGHAARDELVTRATRRLSIVLRSIVGVMPISEVDGHYVPMAVLSNGQYAFLIKGMDSVKVNMAVDEVEAAMQKPFFYQGIALSPGVSFGVANTTSDEDNFKLLFDHCVTSLIADKERGNVKNSQIESINQYNPRNISLINQLREAIQEDKLTLYFQSTYALKSQKVCGIEVLCRWEGLKGETVSPFEIFYLAEVGGFVSELTLKVIEKAIQNYLLAVDISKSSVKVSINISPKCVRDGRFLEQVSALLDRYAMPGHLMAFEIKESAIIEDPSITRDALNQIRAMGIGLTIDEFGAAYSNPSYLSSLPVNEVKLDPRLVAQLENPAQKKVLQSLVQLCREHDIKLVVHGVEDESTLSRLEEIGCSFAQGHHLSIPVPAQQYNLPASESRKSRYLKVS